VGGILYAAVFAFGGAVAVLLVWKTRVPLPAVVLLTVAVGVIAYIAFGETYRDEFCEEDTACRIVAEPALLTFTAFVPGVALGLMSAALGRGLQRREHD
jgi:hypothetical protein